MRATAALLDELLQTLLEEEATLSKLLGLALEEQEALVESDFDAIDSVSAQMAEVAGVLESLEQRREQLMESVGQAGCTFEELAALADNHGVGGFSEARTRLAVAARELREAQECNANLIMGAMRLRERWLGLLAGMEAPTYGAGGRQELSQGRGFVSRSA